VLRLPAIPRRRIERAPAGVGLVEDQAQRVEVGLRRRRPAVELLGCHVGRRAHHLGGAAVLRPHREAEVGDARAAFAIDHHVRGLEIAMDDTAIVRRGEPGAELARHLVGLGPRQSADALQERREVFAVDILHRQEELAAHLADVVDAADVGVRDLARVPHLAAEALEHVGPLGECSAEELERHRLRELEVVGAVDLAHAAAAEEPDHPVASGEHLAGLERGAPEAPRGVEPADRGGRAGPRPGPPG
jgi:hypothetical protein